MLKPIFNSLGSNYSFGFSVAALWQIFFSRTAALEDLKKNLNEKFTGESFLFYKGRDAIEFALRAIGIGCDDSVLTQAFTCQAIEEAIGRAGATTIFCDLEKNQLNPSVETLEAVYTIASQSTKPKALIIQHTLGVPANISEISSWCREHNLLLIEDLAQSFGFSDERGQKLGSYADIVICSFGRDKVIDAVSGGAVIFKKKMLSRMKEKSPTFSERVSWFVICRDMYYPTLTRKIRQTHAYGVGKILFRVAKMTGFLTSPIESPTHAMARMPAAYAALALRQMREFSQQLKQRKRITKIYQEELGKLALPQPRVKTDVVLRFPILVKDPTELGKRLIRQRIFLTDRWYRKAVDFGSLKKKTSYVHGSCPNAEYLADHIFNLPTHRGIRESDARRIIRELKK
jgi:dTDP-4-amino-4,6-dideoxygalactose transaminase